VRQEQRDLNTLATFIAWAPDPAGPGEVAVGYCSLFEQPGDAAAAYVGVLSAHPDWHGRGIGRDLLKAALERTVALGYSRLDLHTWAGNLKAVPLYKKSGYFWAPETSVRMENYLPLVFRLAPAQVFFQAADWYRDFRRDLSLKPDEERRGKLEVYSYTWEHGARRLQVVIDRRAQGVVAVETEDYAVSTEIDDPRLPVGGRREVRWRVESRRAPALPVSLLATGEDSVRCTLQASAVVERVQEWTAPVTAEQPATPAPAGRPANRVHTTVVVAGEALPLTLGTQVVQPVSVAVDVGGRWLLPGATRRLWVTAENALDEAVRGTLHVAGTADLAVEGDGLVFDLGPRHRISWPVPVRASSPGLHTLRAQATVRVVPPRRVPVVAGGAPPGGPDSPASGASPERPLGAAAPAVQSVEPRGGAVRRSWPGLGGADWGSAAPTRDRPAGRPPRTVRRRTTGACPSYAPRSSSRPCPVASPARCSSSRRTTRCASPPTG
jgi:hypothetical protein